MASTPSHTAPPRIKSGGENIYPVVIERHIVAAPAISDATAVQKPDERWGEIPVVFTPRTDDALTTDDVIGTRRSHIATHKLPKEAHFLVTEELPGGASRKILRHLPEARMGRG